MAGFVIVVDMQHDFVMASGALPVPDAEAIVAPMAEWLAALDPAETAGVLMTFDTHVASIYDGSAEAAQFPIHCERGTEGWETVLDPGVIDPAIPVYALEKGVFDMWEEPGLRIRPLAGGAEVDRDHFFERLAASGVTMVTVVGVAADYCVRWAADGLIARGFAVELPAALTRGIAQGIEAVAGDLRAKGAVALV
ncbi:isochorismatase family protein [Novosphingobium sp. BL-8H]|uniref:cysteine hydrolase family protein n=1 Tax=Novosphingobium sp. BL-8H TaxID=3127640 RepID=UPI0037568B1C